MAQIKLEQMKAMGMEVRAYSAAAAPVCSRLLLSAPVCSCLLWLFFWLMVAYRFIVTYGAAFFFCTRPCCVVCLVSP